MRVRSDGKSISQPFEANKLINFMRTLEVRYGFKIGCQDPKLEIDSKHGSLRPLAKCPLRFHPEKDNVIRQVLTIYLDALKWSFRDFEQFSAILESRGLVATAWQRRDNNGNNLVVKGIDSEGVVISRPFSLDRECGIDSLSLFDEAMKDKAALRSTTYSSRIKCRTVCEFAMRKSRSFAEFRKVCHECGIWVGFRDGHNKARLNRVLVVDRRNLAVFDSDELADELSVKTFRHLIVDGIWHEADDEEKGKIRKSKLVSPSEIVSINQIALNRLESDRGRVLDYSVGTHHDERIDLGRSLKH
jgi:hypothetical protein